ncbi:MAG: hypothetical protein IJ501_02555 [Bacilli bacterium]|nr:hypothetical protein [Bacilli bacterium]
MFNNPYNMYPYMNQGMNMARGIPMVGAVKSSKGGFFKTLSTIKWGSILNNTQKTLNVINQAIPVYYQIKPICSNLKSFGKIMSIFNEPDNNSNNNNSNQINNLNQNSSQSNNSNQINTINKKENSQGLPTFFIN